MKRRGSSLGMNADMHDTDLQISMPKPYLKTTEEVNHHANSVTDHFSGN
jgi:hypothetical protein